MITTRAIGAGGVLVLCVLGAGCVVSRTSTTVRNEVSIAMRDGSRADGCDPGDPRLVRAMSEVAAVVGRPVELQIFFDRLPRPMAPFCEALFEREVGTLPRDLALLRDRAPELFAFAQPLLTRVVLDYDGTRSGTEASFDDGVLTFVMGSWAGLPEGGVRYAVSDAYRSHLIARFRGRGASEVAPAEHAAYFEYLRHLIGEGEPSSDRSDRINTPRALAIPRAVELAGLVREAPLREELRRWLLDQADFFAGARFRDRDQVDRAGPDSTYRRAETAWAAWLRRELPGLPEDEVARQWQSLLLSREGNVELVVEFDAIGFALGVVDRWLAAGAPGPGDERLSSLAAHVICPCARTDGGALTCAGGEGELYRYVLADPARRARFIDEVLRRDDERLTLVVADRFRREGSAQGDLLDLFTLAEDHDRSWRVIARYVAEELRHHVDEGGMASFRSSLVDAAARLWRSHPAWRPDLLYLLALFDGLYGRYHGMVEWDRFGQTFGAPVSRDDFAAFLDRGPLAADAAWAVWPALGPGWSRVEVLMPRLATHGGIPGLRIDQALWRVVHQLRRDEVAAVRAYLQQRVRENPAEHGLWHGFLEERP